MPLNIRHLLVTGLVGLSAAAVMLWITGHGPGVTTDSILYIETANNLLRGAGFYAAGAPVTQIPPVYPLLLAAASSVAANSLEAARWLDALLFGVNLVLFALIIYESTERSVLAATFGAFLFATSAPILTVHSYVWSEAAFLSFALAGMLLLAAHIARPGVPLLISSSMFLGLAMATRYAGITLLAPMLVGLLWMRERTAPHRRRDALIALVLASVPLGVWLIRNMLIAGSPTDRSLAVHPLTITNVHAFVVTLHDFVLPLPIANWEKAVDLAFLSGAFALGLALFLWQHIGRSSRHAAATGTPVLSLVFAAVYLVFVFVTMSFFDVTTSLDNRLLSPFVLFVAPAVFSVASSWSRRMEKPVMWWSVVLICVIVLAVNANRTVRWAVDAARNGQDYTSRQWRESETLAYARSLPVDTQIYANDPYVIRFLAGKRAMLIPKDTLPLTGKPNPRYPMEVKAMCTACAEQGAVLVWLDGAGPWFAHLRLEFESTCRFRSRLHLADGTVYGAPAAQR